MVLLIQKKASKIMLLFIEETVKQGVIQKRVYVKLYRGNKK